MRQVFVGREVELDALERLFDEAAGGNGQLGFVVGEPGIGKTRLAEELARLVERRGSHVVWGRAWEGGGTPPFWPWRQALRRLLAIPAVAARLPPSALPSAVVDLALERSAGTATDDARFGLYEAVSDVLRRAAEDVPILLVLDDVHVADVSSLELLRFVARDLRGSRLLVLVTSRELSLFASSEVSAILEKTARDAMLVSLARLQRGDLVRWLDEVAPALSGDVDALLQRSDGNPLFVSELVAVARAGGAALPLGIRAAIRDHLALLGDETRRVIEVAAVGGREIPRTTLAAILDQPAELDQRLDEAIAKGIVALGEGGVVRFTHVLLRDELYAAIQASRRAELHRRAWRAGGDPAAALHHALAGARPEDGADLARTATLAVKDAVARHAFDDGSALAARALAQIGAGEGCPPIVAAELHCAAAEAAMFGGRRDEAVRHCIAAADLAEGAGAVELLARAALIAAYEPSMTPRPDVVRLLRRAEVALPREDSPLRAIVLGRLARAMLPPAPHEIAEYVALRTASIEMARRVGSRQDVLDALRLAMEGFQDRLSIPEQLALNAEAIGLAEELGRSATVVPLLPYQVSYHLQLGDAPGAWREVARAEAILGRLGKTPHYRWRAPLMRAVLLLLEGRFAEADEEQRRALAAARTADDRQGILFFSLQRIMFAYVLGDGDVLEEFAAISAEAQAGIPLTDLFKALEHAITGRRDEARACLARFNPDRAAGIPGVATLGVPCAEAGLADLVPTFLPWVESAVATAPMQFGPGAIVTFGPMKIALGRLLFLIGRLDEAEVALREGRAFAELIGARPCVVQADLALARVAAARGRADAASALGRAAAEGASALGMRRIAAQAEAIVGGGSSDPAAAPVARPGPPTLQLTREGALWRLEAGSTQLLLKDIRGLSYLDELLRRPHREVHVLELASRGEAGDAGPLLDGPAKAAYRERIASLRGEIDEAESNHDAGRRERLEHELEAVTRELLRAVGLGGRDRLAGSRSELARSSVQRRLRDAIKRIAEQAPSLGRHLELSVKTGTFCMYAPTWPDEDR